jgi:hypothetical protein
MRKSLNPISDFGIGEPNACEGIDAAHEDYASRESLTARRARFGRFDVEANHSGAILVR